MTATLCAPCVLAPDPAALERFWAALVSPGDVHAVRVPNTRRGPLRLFGTAEGYFDDVERFVSDVSPISGQDAPGVYVTLNPVSPALLARADNRLVDRAKSAAGDGDALRRRHLLIDTDPVRQPRDVSATDEELAKALSRRDAARRYLAEQHGWPDPAAVTHSGNGGGLIYRIDLPNDAAATALIRDVLAALDHLFSDEIVTADAGNFNAARITKIVGSVAAKGENFSGTDRAPARPWRLATATYPPQPGVVTPALLAAVAALAPRVAPAPQALRLGAGLAPAPRLWTVEDLLAVNGLAARPKRQGYGTVYQLDRCLSSEDHADGAVLLEMANGAIVYRCLHERCRGKDWRFLREHGLVTIPGAAHGTGHAPPTPNGHGSVNGRSGAPGGSRADQGEEDGKARFSRLTDIENRENRENRAFTLTRLDALLAEQPEEIEWTVADLLPRAGLSILAAKPKVGKSTLARTLALCVAKGTDFLGRPCAQGPAIYLALEEKRAEVAKHFRRMGATNEPVFIHVGSAPEAALDALEQAITAHSAVLAIVDPVFKLLRVIDANAYAEVNRAFEPLINLARQTGCHILTVHHMGKGERAGGDALLGSTAIFGAVDAALLMKRRDMGRTIESVQRYGVDLAETVVALDAETGIVSAAGDVAAMENRKVAEAILDALGEETLSEGDIKERLGGNQTATARALRALREAELLLRTGDGKRGAPYLYTATAAVDLIT